MIENELRNYAIKVAQNCSKPFSSVTTYAQQEKDVPYQEENTQCFFEEIQHELQGWILEEYYEKWYETQGANDILLSSEQRHFYYILGINGSLVVTTIRTDITGPGILGGNRTIRETKQIETNPMSFNLPDKSDEGNDGVIDLASLLYCKHSAYFLDYQANEWRTIRSISSDGYPNDYIDRNYPLFLGRGDAKQGGATAVESSQGNGLLRRLKLIESKT